MRTEDKTNGGGSAGGFAGTDFTCTRQKRLYLALAAALALHVLGAAFLSLTGFKVLPVKSPEVIELDLTAPLPRGNPAAVQVAASPVAAAQPVAEQEKPPQEERTAEPRPLPAPAENPIVESSREAVDDTSSQLAVSSSQAPSGSAEGGIRGNSNGSISGSANGTGGGQSAPAPEPAAPVSDGVPVTPPNLLSAPEPAYPESLQAKNIEGTVNVGMTVNASGGVDSAYVAGSSGYPAMDAAAVNVAYRWRFSPARDNSGAPCACTVTLPVSFTLN